jgi:hypothetical protein
VKWFEELVKNSRVAEDETLFSLLSMRVEKYTDHLKDL